ncbi:MAG: hypothetical protein ABFE02_09615 [Sulfuricella sp.]
MKFNIPQGGHSFEIPDEWWENSGMVDCTPLSSHYHTDPTCSTIVPFNEVVPPLRDGDEIWFRNRETVIQLLTKMCDGIELPPIEVWSKEKKCSNRYVVRDGLHRFYLSIAIGYTEIPIRITDFDLDEFLRNEVKGPPGTLAC